MILPYRHTPTVYEVYPGAHIDEHIEVAGDRWELDCPEMMWFAPIIIAVERRLNNDGTPAPEGARRCCPIAGRREACTYLQPTSPSRAFNASPEVQHFFLTEGRHPKTSGRTAKVHAVRVVKPGVEGRDLTLRSFIEPADGVKRLPTSQHTVWRFAHGDQVYLVLLEPYITHAILPTLQQMRRAAGLTS